MRVALLLCLLAPLSRLSLADEAPPPDPDAPSLKLVPRVGDKVVSTPTVRIGEPFHVELDATAAAGVSVSMAADFDQGVDGSVFSVTEKDLGVAGADWRFDLTVLVWQTGSQTLPPITVHYNAHGEDRKIATGPLAVEVSASLTDADKAKPTPRGLAAPVSVWERDWRLIIAAAAVAGALAAGAIAWAIATMLRRRRRIARKLEAAIDRRTPEEIALGKLAQLEASGMLDPADADRRPLYFALTEIGRDYLGRRYGFDALELTTSETIAALEEANVPGELKVLATSWMVDCDLIKFAAAPASREDGARALARARELVERCRPVVVHMPPPAEAARAG